MQSKSRFITILFKCIAVFVVFFTKQELTAQTVPAPTLNQSLIPPSPNAATFAKVGNLPVTIYNGLPNVTIPIFDLKVGSLEMPIGLDYNYSGFKPKEEASWVGLGWNLNAGGVVSRVVRGDADGSKNAGSNYEDINAFDSALNFPQNQPFLTGIVDHNYDAEPDIYTFHFNGYSGKFIYYKGKGYLMPFAKLQIYIPPNKTYVRIIDEHGNNYLFQATETSAPKSQPDYAAPAYKSSWFLTQVVSADLNDTINLNYTATTVVEGSSPYSQTYAQWVPQSCPGDVVNGPGNTDKFSPYTYSGTTLNSFQLSTITSRNYTVSFVPTPASRKDLDSRGNYPALNAVMVFNNFPGNTSQVKQFNFYYSYFGDSTANYRCRLQLLGVSDNDVISQTGVQNYNFTYAGTSGIDKKTVGIDYWGYYNGYDNNLSLFPSSAIPNPKVQGNGIRDPSLAGAQQAALTSIVYPTGGMTTFQYQLNDYYDINLDATKPGPGIRLGSMSSYDPAVNVHPINKSFVYKDAAGNSTGSIVSTPVFQSRLYTLQNSILVNVAGSGGATEACIGQFNNYTANFTSITGAMLNQDLYYAYVSEIEGTGDTASRTDYYFNCNCGNQYDYYTGVQMTEKVEFKNMGSSVYKKVRETDYSYTFRMDTLFDGVQAYLSEHIDYGYSPINTGAPNIYGDTIYNVPVAWSALSSEVTKLFDDQGGVYTSSKFYTYNPVTRNVSSTTLSSSDGRTVVQYFKYPEDYIASITGRLVNSHVLDRQIEEQSWLWTNSTDSTLIGGRITQYDTLLFKPINEYFFENSAPPVLSLNNQTQTNGLYNTLISDSRYVNRISYQYGAYGMLAQQNMSNDINNSIIWGYNNSLPVAQVKNAASNQIAFTSFEDGAGGGWTLSGNTLSGGITGTLSFSGQLQKAIPTGNYIVTLWSQGSNAATVNGSAGSAVITKNNWTLYQWQLSSVSLVTVSGSDLDEVRLFPANSQMVTYTYAPGFGISTQANVNNLITYYEYDGFGRLRLIRDQDRNIVKLFSYFYRNQNSSGINLQ